MSIKHCPECNHEISSDANVCPFCGLPINGKKIFYAWFPFEEEIVIDGIKKKEIVLKNIKNSTFLIEDFMQIGLKNYSFYYEKYGTIMGPGPFHAVYASEASKDIVFYVNDIEIWSLPDGMFRKKG